MQTGILKIPYFEVSAFTDRSFAGNPAGVCPLKEWLPAASLQQIAAENNLSETAFFVPRGEQFELRWFTPAAEIDLCGHATLAAAFVLFSQLGFQRDRVEFHSRSGLLTVTRNVDLLTLDFPSRPPVPASVPDDLIKALGITPLEILKARDYMAVYRSEHEVRSLKPDFSLLQALGDMVIVTAPGTDCDFVSRFFAPSLGVPEDPVTGSAHCTLIPYWSAKLGKSELFARQVSRRGGELFCRLEGDRVHIGGKAVLYLRGGIEINGAPIA